MTDEDYLKSKNVRITALRLLIWKYANKFDYVFSLEDMENVLNTVDKSTIFRTLSIFIEKDILHHVDDGSGLQKYCLCRCSNNKHDCHVHLTCEICKKTICIKNEEIPAVKVPEGFVVHSLNYVIKGICKECSKKSKTKNL